MVLDKTIFPFKKIQDESIKSADKKIGWICTYTPEELIMASGFLPFRITGKEKAKKAEGYFPINFCPFIKSAMEDLLNCDEKLSGMIFTNSCDGMRRFYDSCAEYMPSLPSFLLDVPRIKNPLSVQHFAANIEQMASFLESIGTKKKKIGYQELKQAILLCDEKRALLSRLNDYFKKFNKKIGVKNYFEILKTSMTEPPVFFLKELKEYLDKIAVFLESDAQTSFPEIMIIGNFIDEERLWEIFDELDCIISVQDTCNAERYFKKYEPEKPEPVKPETIKPKPGKPYDYNAHKGVTGTDSIDNNSIIGPDIKNLYNDIAVSHLYKPQCMRMADLGTKIDEIKDSIEKNNIKGVIFISQKFCDNTLLFYPFLRQELNNIGIPGLFLEIEHRNFSAGQIKTRIQAFLEII